MGLHQFPIPPGKSGAVQNNAEGHASGKGI